MNVGSFYEPADAIRLSRFLRLLAQHDISGWALTGGTAIELHLRHRGASSRLRPLHDVDFIAADFTYLPESLSGLLLPRHVHPLDPPGKNMFQAVDPDTSVRVDVFRAYGREQERVQNIETPELALTMVAFEDLVARHARLCCNLLRGRPLAPKFARDFLRMAEFTETKDVEQVWQEHRQLEDPNTFAEAEVLLREAITSRTDLLTPSVYSTDVDEVCPRCVDTTAFKLGDARQVLFLLGYC